MKTIELSQGKVTIIDDADFDMVNQFKWWYSNQGYAVGKIKIGNKWATLLLHRFLMNLTDPNIFADHKDMNPLNNSRANLRIATRSQNGQNRKSFVGSSSQFKGVDFHKRDKIFRSRIQINGQLIHLGSFICEIAAAKAYDAKAIIHFGEFARLNFPPTTLN